MRMSNLDLSRAQSLWWYKRFRLWGAREREQSGSPVFALLRGQLGNRSPADRERFGCGAARHTRHNKTQGKRRNGMPLARCAPPQRAEFLQVLSGTTVGVRGVRPLPASTHKAD